MMYFKFEMNNLGIVFKAGKQSRVNTWEYL